jgi:hypothetical protein
MTEEIQGDWCFGKKINIMGESVPTIFFSDLPVGRDTENNYITKRGAIFFYFLGPNGMLCAYMGYPAYLKETSSQKTELIKTREPKEVTRADIISDIEIFLKKLADFEANAAIPETKDIGF